MDIAKLRLPENRGQRKWHYDELEVGESLTVFSKLEAKRLRSAAQLWGKNNDRVFTVRRVMGNKYRCWRIK